MQPPGQWITDVAAWTTVSDAIARILKVRIGAVAALVRKARRENGCGVKAVHSLRVAARRADATLRLFQPWIDHGRDAATRRLRRTLRKLRRTAGLIRDCDIHTRVFRQLAEQSAASQAAVLEDLIARIDRRRARAQAKLVRLAGQMSPGRLRQWRRQVAASVQEALIALRPAPTLRDVARASLPPAIERIRSAAAKDLTQRPHLHRLRVLLKRLRYSLELLAPTLGPRFKAEIYPRFEAVQERLGQVNDANTVLARLDAEAERLAGRRAHDPQPALVRLRQRCAAVRDRQTDAFLEWWGSFDILGLLRVLEAAIPADTAALSATHPRPGPRRPPRARRLPRRSPTPASR